MMCGMPCEHREYKTHFSMASSCDYMECRMHMSRLECDYVNSSWMWSWWMHGKHDHVEDAIHMITLNAWRFFYQGECITSVAMVNAWNVWSWWMYYARDHERMMSVIAVNACMLMWNPSKLPCIVIWGVHIIEPKEGTPPIPLQMLLRPSLQTVSNLMIFLTSRIYVL
jgi:hypothetical protein